MRSRLARDRVDGIGDLWNENDVGSAGNPGTQRQPAGSVPHDLHHNNAMVTCRSRMEAIDCLGGDAQRRVEAKADVGHRDVVVDRLRQRDDVQSRLLQTQRVLLRASAATRGQMAPNY